jgi:hypothetical protein
MAADHPSCFSLDKRRSNSLRQTNATNRHESQTFGQHGMAHPFTMCSRPLRLEILVGSVNVVSVSATAKKLKVRPGRGRLLYDAVQRCGRIRLLESVMARCIVVAVCAVQHSMAGGKDFVVSAQRPAHPVIDGKSHHQQMQC